VVAGLKRPPGVVVAIVLVKAVPPLIVVNEVDRGVGAITSTNVVPTEVTVVVDATLPEVVVRVLYTVGTPIRT
jgi:hypothetical protein